MTKSQLAEAARCTLRTLVGYESGALVPPPSRLRELADILRFPESFFSRPELEQLDARGVSFRSLARMRASQREKALAAADLALELNEWVDRRFGLPAVTVPDLSALNDPEAAAMALRSMWALGDKPIPHMIRLLEAHGVRVYSLAEEHDSLDGYSFWRDEIPFVFLNTMKSAERSRFDAAHELAHLVLHRHGWTSRREVEHEAQAFASAFLMPQSSVAAFAPRLPSLDRLIQTKRGWGVSVAALAHRMHNVRLLSDWQYRAICIEIGSSGYRNSEPNPAPREMSLVFEKIFQQLREEGVSKQSLAAELGWPVSELNALVFGLVLASSGGSAKTGTAGGSGVAAVSGKQRLSLVE